MDTGHGSAGATRSEATHQEQAREVEISLPPPPPPLPSLKAVLHGGPSPYSYVKCGSAVLKLILKSFSAVIVTNTKTGPPPIAGVDIAKEER